MLRRVLQSNKNMEDLLGSGQNFERWIKMGSVTKGSAVEDEITLVTGKLEQNKFS